MHLLDIRQVVIGMLDVVVMLVSMLRQQLVGPITIRLVFLVRLSRVLCSFLWWPVGLRRQACSLLVSDELIVLWNGLQNVEVHPVEQVKTVALRRFVVLRVLCTVSIRLLTTLDGEMMRVFVLVRVMVSWVQVLRAVLPLMWLVLLRML